MCEVASWFPSAVAATLRERTAQPLLAWLHDIRATTEDYDSLLGDRAAPDLPEPEDVELTEADAADKVFNTILSKLGKEIYQLDEFQRKLLPGDTSIPNSILNIFDQCLEQISDDVNSDSGQNNLEMETCEPESTAVVTSGCRGYSGDEKTLTGEPLVTSTPIPKARTVMCSDRDSVFVKSDVIPTPPPRARLKLPSSCSSVSEKTELVELESNPRPSESDSESTCWSYKDGSTDAEVDPQKSYAVVWAYSSGFHNSDDILRRVLLQHHATESRLTFESAGELPAAAYRVYSLAEVGGRCARAAEPVVAMTPDRPTRDDGYEPVRDAITDDNIYEEIEFGYSYTDEGCSCGGGSIEVESCSISGTSSCVGRESPLYANLRDNDAYAVPPDVIYWKNLLLHPDYNDDEEDEWITPEECAVYSREQRPPLVIPRITQYRTPRRNQNANVYVEISSPIYDPPSSQKQYDRLHNQSPQSERGRAEFERMFRNANNESPPFARINKRLGTSTENLLISNGRRPNNLHLPASSSGDSLDVEVREKEPSLRKRQSRSMMAPKPRVRSPVPAPRLMLQKPEITVDYEGPVKRTRYLESGKKCKKNWADCYMVLTSTALVFYRDQKTYYASKQPKPAGTPPSPSGARAELVLPLKNAHVVQCISTHTRRYNRSIMLTVGYDQYLIQDDTEDGARRWLKCIQNIIYNLGPSEDFRSPQFQSSSTDLESLGRTPPVARHARSKHKAGGSSNEDLSDSTEVSIQKSHVRSRLRKFFARRPGMDVLIKKGIYKDEPVFGRNLEEVCPASSPRVPEFVVACIKEIESSEENMCTDGLYRASGNLSQVQKIRLEIDQNNLSVIESSADIHVLTGSLKLFFRELKEPLIPCHMFDRVLAACSLKSRDARIREFRDVVQALPQCNRDTLKYLLEHLLRVTQYSEHNRMHKANLAIVFGPTLLWAPLAQAHNIAIDCIQQNNVVETLLNDFKDIFVDDNTKGKKKT